MWLPFFDKLVFTKEKPTLTSDIQHWNNVYTVKVNPITSPKKNSVIIYAHGNKWDLGRLRNERILHKIANITHCPIVAFEFAGYGVDHKNPVSSEQTVQNILSTFKTLRRQYHHVYFYGFSIGAGIVAEAFNRLKIDRKPFPSAIFLQGAFTSVLDTPEAKRKLGAFHGTCKLFFNLFQVQDILIEKTKRKLPLVYFIHGTRDQTCPFAPIEKLAHVIDAKMIWIEEGGHNQLEDAPEFAKLLGEAFRKLP